MAPEIFQSSEGHGRAADVWSVACVVIEMLTGKVRVVFGVIPFVSYLLLLTFFLFSCFFSIFFFLISSDLPSFQVSFLFLPIIYKKLTSLCHTFIHSIRKVIYHSFSKMVAVIKYNHNFFS